MAELGAIMGSGGLIVMNEDKCAVDMARFFMDFCKDESCGKCTPCREGTQRMLDILTNICKGKGKEGDIELLESMATVIMDAALCGLGQTAPNPVLSTIRYFRKNTRSTSATRSAAPPSARPFSSRPASTPVPSAWTSRPTSRSSATTGSRTPTR